MKIVLIILLSALTWASCEYRPKPRGPPPFPARPQLQHKQQFATKKLYRPPGPVRSRPQASHKQSMLSQMGVPPSRQPSRNYWKSKPISNVKFPFGDGFGEGYKLAVPPKATFLGSAAQEFDYHIQTNNIPTTLTNPIKQIGEKGPIHTIPAPNLSLKDKPIVVEEVRYHQHQHQQPIQLQQQQQQLQLQLQHPQQHLHEQLQQSYQVTEKTDSSNKQKVYKLPVQVQQELQQHKMIQQQQQQQKYQQQYQAQIYDPLQKKIQQQLLQQQQQQQHVEVQPQQVQYYGADTVVIPPMGKPQEIFLGDNLSPQELYDLIGAAYPQAVVAQGAPANPNYQAILSETLFKPEQSTTSSDQALPKDQASFKPEFQSFNYDEQAHQNSQKVTAGYNLNDFPPEISSRSTNAKESFDSRSDTVEGEQNHEKQEKVDDKLLGSTYYSSLPNKEAAERLQQLQQAGKINSKLMVMSDGEKDPLAIIAEEFESGETKSDEVEYDEYSKEDLEMSGKENGEFGQRLKTKQS